MRAELAKSYQELVETLGTPEFARALFRSCARAMPIDELFGFERDFAEGLVVLAQFGSPTGASERLTAPQSRYRNADPLTRIIVRRRGVSAATLRVAADQIRNTLWRRECYERFRYGERISVARRYGDGWCVLNLYRRRDRGIASDESVQRLEEMAVLALPLMLKHGPLATRVSPSLGTALEQAIFKLSQRYPELAGREREVCARTLLGAHSGAIALALGITQSTVLTYRRRAYDKLGISSAAELTAALIN